MALIDDIIAEIPHARLRSRLQTEADALRQRGQFGITFERHSPEVLILPGARVRPGVRVCRRGQPTDSAFIVHALEADQAVCIPDGGAGEQRIPASALAVIKREGESVFPALRLVDSVQRGGSHPHHLVIEGENYSALQLLKWLYPKRVDCIYIDPPYNTGEQTWKYNNDFVDRNDAFMSSK